MNGTLVVAMMNKKENWSLHEEGNQRKIYLQNLSIENIGVRFVLLICEVLQTILWAHKLQHTHKKT